jgi:hypothetical protein
MLNVVPITADRIGDRDRADGGGGGFLFFAFCFFAALCADRCRVRSFDLTRTPPRRICFRSLDRSCHEAAAKGLTHTVNRR